MAIADDTVGGLGLGAMAGKVAEKLPQELARPGLVTGSGERTRNPRCPPGEDGPCM